jgi:tetratricopeptide (TPR) repeat protein
LTGVDSEVVEVLQEARDRVLRQRSSAVAWGQFGKLLYAHQFNDEALTCLRQAEALDRREPAWPYLQGLIIILEDPDGGIRCLERAVQSQPNGPISIRLRLAEALLAQRRLDEAQVQMEEARKLDPDNLRVRLGLGRLAILHENWQSGLDLLEPCQDDVHARRLARSLRAEALYRLGQPERAREEQRKTAELPADEPWPDPLFDEVLDSQRGIRARLTKAHELSKAGHVEETVALLRKVLERYPDSLEAWMQLGDVWFAAHQMDQAEACYQKSVAINPNAAEAWYHLGYVQAQIHAPKAETSLREAIRLRPDHALAHCSLGLLLKEKGDRNGAITELQASLHHRPDYEPARAALNGLTNEPSGKDPRAKEPRTK